jgi:hypothetical protein
MGSLKVHGIAVHLFQQVVEGLVQLAEPCVLVLREGHACSR